MGGFVAKGGGFSLNESPSEKEGKSRGKPKTQRPDFPSMKVPPKRKGNEAGIDVNRSGKNPQ